MPTKMTPTTTHAQRLSKQNVWVLIIDHQHGTDISVHASCQDARQALYAYCAQQWDDGLTKQYGALSKLSLEAAIDAYFDAWGMAWDYEYYLLEERPIGT